MLSYVISLITHLRWAFELLFRQSFFGHRVVEVEAPEIYEERNVVVRCHRLNSNEGDEECTVCLCKLGQGEEIGELRCHHQFHKVCLDRRVGRYGRPICPLCRDSLASAPPPTIDCGMQILTFKKFSSATATATATATERDSWWIR